MATNLAENEEAVGHAQNETVEYFNIYDAQRTHINDFTEVADYMYSCAQNRTLESAEKGYGMNMGDDTRSNVGSSLFHRIVNQNAAQLEAVLLSKPDLWRYETFSADASDKTEDGEDRAEMLKLLARYTIKTDKFLEKLPMATRMLYKKSNIFMRVGQNRVEKEHRWKEPDYEIDLDEQGNAVTRIVGERDRSEKKIVRNHPTFDFPPISSIYLDAYLGDMQQQPCVIIHSLKTRGELKAGVDAGWYSEKQYEELTDKYTWDGEEGTDELKTKEEQRNNNPTIEPQKNLFLVWDVYLMAPITDNGEWDEEGDTEWKRWWLTFVGNDIGSSLCLRFERNPEPDDEVPLKDIHIYPDDGDRMYHTTTAELLRSAYSADCTLLNLALDNMGFANDPPKWVVDGMHNVKDWTNRKGAVWHVDNPDAIGFLQVPNIPQETNAMREYVRDGAMMAMNVDKGFVGQSQGARTSASEATFINRNSMQPHLSQIRYVLMQMLPWMARKMQSYWMAYGDPTQVLQITDENKRYDVHPTELAGEYDVKVEIIDEYESDLLKQQALQNVMNIVGGSEFFQKGGDVQVDGPALLREWLLSQKIDPSRILTTPYHGDSVRVARERIEAMIRGGEYVPPEPDANLRVHLQEAKKELSKWKGVEDEAVGEGVRIDLLKQYIAEIEQAMAGGGQEGGVASMPRPQGVEQGLQGNQVGNVLAEAMGGMQ